MTTILWFRQDSCLLW